MLRGFLFSLEQKAEIWMNMKGRKTPEIQSAGCKRCVVTLWSRFWTSQQELPHVIMHDWSCSALHGSTCRVCVNDSGISPFIVADRPWCRGHPGHSSCGSSLSRVPSLGAQARPRTGPMLPPWPSCTHPGAACGTGSPSVSAEACRVRKSVSRCGMKEPEREQRAGDLHGCDTGWWLRSGSVCVWGEELRKHTHTSWSQVRAWTTTRNTEQRTLSCVRVTWPNTWCHMTTAAGREL